jgi:hypothetical protein
MNKTTYQNQLLTLSTEIQKLNSTLADSDHKILDNMFDMVYQSDVLNITHLSKDQQDLFKLELFTTLTQYSGTLAFLVIQILAAHNIMAKHNYSKLSYYKNKKCGIAINHLRAPKTIVEAKKVKGGYTLNGTLTWASGYQIFDTLLIGFHYEDLEMEAMASFIEQVGFTIGQADETFVGYGLNTVNIILQDFFVKEEDIVSSNPKGNYTKNKSASKTVHFCIYGLGISALNNISDLEMKQIGLERLLHIKKQFLTSNDTVKLDSLRIELFHTVQQIVTTGIILNGGSSILLEKPLQRIYRELIMFNSNGLNNTLKSLFKVQFLKDI